MIMGSGFESVWCTFFRSSFRDVFLENSKSGVDDRGHRLRSGSPVTIYPSASPTMSIYRSMADSGGYSLLEVHRSLIYRNSHDKFQSCSFGAKITTSTHTACLHGISSPKVVK